MTGRLQIVASGPPVYAPGQLLAAAVDPGSAGALGNAVYNNQYVADSKAGWERLSMDERGRMEVWYAV